MGWFLPFITGVVVPFIIGVGVFVGGVVAIDAMCFKSNRDGIKPWQDGGDK